MPKTTQYSIPSGTFVSIPCTMPCRRVDIAEDGSVAAQGIKVQLPRDNYVTTQLIPFAQEPFILGNKLASGGGIGPLLGLPVQNSTSIPGGTNPATIYCKLSSGGASATLVNVTEIE